MITYKTTIPQFARVSEFPIGDLHHLVIRYAVQPIGKNEYGDHEYDISKMFRLLRRAGHVPPVHPLLGEVSNA